jgi:two-component system cell cycle response regulator DivK
MLLVNEGYTVLTAASAEEALELLRSYHPRLILADIQLPGMDGLEMTRLIKRDEATRDIAVVALTAFAMKGDEQKAIDAGCDGYITKPIDTRTLGEKIRQLLSGRGEPAPAAPVRPSRKRFRRPKCMRCAIVSCRKARNGRASCCWIWTVDSTPRRPPARCTMGGNRRIARLYDTGAPGSRSGGPAAGTAGGLGPGARIAHQSAAGFQHAARGPGSSRPRESSCGRCAGSAWRLWACPRMRRNVCAWRWSGFGRGRFFSS